MYFILFILCTKDASGDESVDSDFDIPEEELLGQADETDEHVDIESDEDQAEKVI